MVCVLCNFEIPLVLGYLLFQFCDLSLGLRMRILRSFKLFLRLCQLFTQTADVIFITLDLLLRVRLACLIYSNSIFIRGLLLVLWPKALVTAQIWYTLQKDHVFFVEWNKVNIKALLELIAFINFSGVVSILGKVLPLFIQASHGNPLVYVQILVLILSFFPFLSFDFFYLLSLSKFNNNWGLFNFLSVDYLELFRSVFNLFYFILSFNLKFFVLILSDFDLWHLIYLTKEVIASRDSSLDRSSKCNGLIHIMYFLEWFAKVLFDKLLDTC